MSRNLFNLHKKRFGDLREFVIKRDGEKCVSCGTSRSEHKIRFGCDIIVNHKDGNGRYAESPNHTLSNLETLCLVCHGKKDRKRERDFYDLPLESRRKKLTNLRNVGSAMIEKGGVLI